MTYESHLSELPEDAPWDEKPGESVVEQHDTDAIPEVDVTEEDIAASGEDETNWLIFGNNYEGQRHTTADVITPENVGDLEVEYTLELGEPPNDFQGSPIVVGGDPPVIYQTIGPDMLYAINGRTGDILWTHFYENADGASDETPPAERGPAVLGDTVYKSTLDLGVLAIDRYTGEEKWYYNGAAAYRGEAADDVRHEELQWERARGTTSSHPPMIYDGMLMKGSFGGEFGVSGFYDAIDLEGNPQWRVNMTPEHEWVGDSWQHGGSTAWAASCVEPESGTVVIPAANPGPWYGTVRPGWNPYTCGKVGVDVETGEYQWHHQDAPHDWWDYDSPSPPLVFEEEVGGETRKFASWPGKTGWVYTIDMETGQLHQRSEEFVQHNNMWTLPPYDDIENAQWIMPNLIGGTNPQTSSFDPESRTMIVKGTNIPMKLAWFEVEYEPGETYIGMDIEFAPVEGEREEEGEEEEEETDEGDEAETEEETTEAEDDPEEVETDEAEEDEGLGEEEEEEWRDEWNGNIGVLAGIDPITGEVKWQNWYDETETPPWGGSLTTTTGVTFAGDGQDLFTAFDTETGQELASWDLGYAASGAPVSWYDPNEGKQYVAAPAGGERESYTEPGNHFVVLSLEE